MQAQMQKQMQMQSLEAQWQADAEGLTLRTADNKTGYLYISVCARSLNSPFKAQVLHHCHYLGCSSGCTRNGKAVALGNYGTAEEAALSVARSPEGKAAAQAAEEFGTNDRGNNVNQHRGEQRPRNPRPPGAEGRRRRKEKKRGAQAARLAALHDSRLSSAPRKHAYRPHRSRGDLA